MSPTVARYLLAGVRLFNGAAALAVPRPFGRQAGLDPDADPGAVYILRLFGVRTVYLAGELLLRRGRGLDGALAVAPAIHAADAVSAALAGVTGDLPRRKATVATSISTVNLVLALVASRSRRS